MDHGKCSLNTQLSIILTFLSSLLSVEQEHEEKKMGWFLKRGGGGGGGGGRGGGGGLQGFCSVSRNLLTPLASAQRLRGGGGGQCKTRG